jgi:hypothetical protein
MTNNRRDWLPLATAFAFLAAAVALMLLPIVSLRADFDDGGLVLDLDATGLLLMLDRSDPFVAMAAALTVGVLGLGIATVTLHGRIRAGAALAAALLAALTLTATAMWMKEAMEPAVAELIGEADHFGYGYGFWLVLGLLGVTVVANLPAAVTRPATAVAPAAV